MNTVLMHFSKITVLSKTSNNVMLHLFSSSKAVLSVRQYIQKRGRIPIYTTYMLLAKELKITLAVHFQNKDA